MINSGDWTALIIAGEAILVSLALGVVLLMLLRSSRRQIAELQAQIKQLTRCQVSSFLEREMINTRDMVKRAPATDMRVQLLAKLRLRWLELEQKALQNEGGSRSDTVQLARASRPLFALLDKLPEKEASAPAHQVTHRVGNGAEEALSMARATMLMQKNVISRLREQLAAASAVASTPSDAFRPETLEKVSENTEAQLSSVARLEKELKAARASYQQVSDELAQLHARSNQKSFGATQEQGLLIVSQGEKAPSIDMTTARGWLNEMDDAHTESLSELRRMRDTNARQRALILELEGELAQMRNGSAESDASHSLLENLKQQLREYENCTSVLEMETENLRARIETLNHIIEQSERSGKLDFVDDLQREMGDATESKQRTTQMGNSLVGLADIANATSVEQAVALLRGIFGNDIRSFTLMVKGQAKQYWFSSEGDSVDSRVRQLLQSVVPSADSPWIDVKGGAIFASSTLRIYLENTDQTATDFDKASRALAPQLHIINALLHLLDIRGQQPSQLLKLDDLMAQVAKKLAAVDVQHHYLSEENARVGASLQSELQQYFAALSLTSTQRECIEAMLADFRAEVTLLTKASQAVHRQLRVVMTILDVKRDEQN